MKEICVIDRSTNNAIEALEGFVLHWPCTSTIIISKLLVIPCTSLVLPGGLLARTSSANARKASST